MEQTEASRSDLFGAFRGAAPSQRPWLKTAAVVTLLVAGAAAAFAAMSNRPIQVVTPYGIRSLELGMSPDQVATVMGRAVATETLNGQLCHRYARPSRKEETVAVYTVCYQDGRLVQVSEKPYGLWKMKKDGTVVPMVEKPAPPEPQSPSLP